MYDVGFRESADKKLRKLKKKDPKTFESVLKKIEELQINPHRYKNLKKPCQKYKRVHKANSFVLIFSVDEKNRKIIIQRYSHH